MLQLVRYEFHPERTFGKLAQDGVFLCYTLEDGEQTGVKVGQKGRIPAGEYRVDLTWSPRFNRILPLLDAVPGYEGIRIHSGNTERDTEGCILVGLNRDEVEIINSRAALQKLLERVTFPTEIEILESHPDPP